MYIYKITNLVNGKMYIGQSSKVVEESKNYYGSGLLIKRSIEKYGIENFKKEILENCETQLELGDREIHWISKFNSMIPAGYNLTNGGRGVGFGKGHPNYGIPNTAEQKRKISEAMTGVKKNPESVRKSAETRTGIPRSAETRAKLSIALKKVMEDPEIRKKCSLGGKNAVWDDERKKAHSEIMQKVCSTEEWLSKNTGRLGIPQTDETKAKISKSNTGKVRGSENKKQISNSVKKLWQNEEYRNNNIEKAKQYCWFCNQSEVLRCKKDKLDEYLGLGYQRGRKWRK